MLTRLWEHQLYAKFSECEFWLDQIPFLGHIILADGVAMDPSKVKDILEWKPPTLVTLFKVSLVWLDNIIGLTLTFQKYTSPLPSRWII